MKIIKTLGTEIETAWRSRRYDERDFPEIVMQALARLRPHDEIDPTDIVRWFIATPPSELPRQVNIDATFGEPPITLYAGPNFYIEALFWLDGTTSVHQHGFSGAFQVIGGSSIHCSFSFEPTEIVNSRMMFGSLDLANAELLAKGDTRAILAGDGLIHSLFHLERPSMTLVVRTYNEPAAQPQWNYLRPTLAIDPFYKQETTTRLLQAIGMLHRSEDPDASLLTATAIRSNDLYTAWLILERFAHIRPNDLTQLNQFLEIATSVHGSTIDLLRPVLREQRRQGHIVARRNTVRNPDHRFFLATLLNLQNSRNILGFIQDRYPDSDPRELIVEWVSALSTSTHQNSSDTIVTPLGFDFEEGELEIFRLLLNGHEPSTAVSLLEQEYDVADNRLEVLALAETLADSLLFKPLFTP